MVDMPLEDIFLDLTLFAERLRTYYIGRKIEMVREIVSTQLAVLRKAEEGEEEGFVLVADRQSSGRGRKGDRWYSPPGTGLYLSLLLRPTFQPWSILPLSIGLSVAQGIEAAAGLTPSLKWPNDIMLEDRKVAGILVESQVQEGRLLGVVAGIGVNVADPEAGWPADLADTAIGVGAGVAREELLAELLNSIELNYDLLREGRTDRVLAEYRRRCAQHPGDPILVSRPDKAAEQATVVQIEPDGALLIECRDGSQERLYGEQITSLRGTR
ncbi:MAG: biotin--[acetyl-CoA-carboxylase] ligase [Acidobacteriota bacterium]